MNEGDEDATTRPEPATAPTPEDNSAGRLLTLADGVFAIAMTLLALDLKVPTFTVSHPTNANLTHALENNAGSYFAFALSFYVVGSYWGRHRRLMRSVRTTHPALIRDTLVLLLIVAAMPFPTSLLGMHGNLPIAVAVYGATNALATITLMFLSRDVRRLGVRPDSADESDHHLGGWINLAVFVLCIPGAYVLGSHGPYILILLALPGRVAVVRRFIKHSGVRRLVHRFHRDGSSERVG